jgi:hypothetical protein
MLAPQKFELTRATSRRALLEHLVSKGLASPRESFEQQYRAAERSLRSLGTVLTVEAEDDE